MANNRVLSRPGRWRRRARPYLACTLACGALLIPRTSIFAQDHSTAVEASQPPPLVAEPPRRSGWTFSAAGQTSLTYTDNVYLSESNETADFVLTPAIILGAQNTGARSILDATFQADYDFYRKATDLNGLRINALVDGTTWSSDDSFFLRGRTASFLQPNSHLGLVPATSRTIGNNQVQVVTYGLAPTFQQPISAMMQAKASYELSGVTFIKPSNRSTETAASNSLIHKARAELSSLHPTTPLTWRLAGSYEQQDLSGLAPTSRRASGQGDGEYRLTSSFALLATGGYEWFDEPSLTGRLNGIFGTGGFMYRPTSRSSLRLEAGYRYQGPHYLGQLRFSPSERLVLIATIDQGIDTTQGAFDRTFGRTVRDPQGNLVDPLTGLPPAAGGTLFDLTNQAFKYTRTSLGLQGVSGRNHYSASANYEWRDANGVNGDSWAAHVEVGRELTRALTATLEGRYAKTTRSGLLVNGPRSETKTGAASLKYQLSRDMTASLQYVHLRQSTPLANYRENAAVLIFRKSF
jgi:uncharacterized protein (PEP-CTERM system associated)